MKRLIFAIVVTVVAASAVAAGASAIERKRKMLSNKRHPSGGIVESAYSGKVFRIVNMQSDFKGEDLAKITKAIRYATHLPIECVAGTLETGKCPFEVADALVAKDDVGAGAIIVKDAKLPIMTIAPDRRWGILNVASLKADNPAQEKFTERFGKLYWNIVARTLGAGNSSYPGCVLMPFANMTQLDAIKATKPCPEPFNKMIETGKAYGIGSISISTYRMACQLGWAPQPTNEIQKVIWDEVHVLPKNPIKILPETKPVKE